jgi:hypothetical protein
MSSQTYTYSYTWVQTRAETIQDQFRYLLTYGDVCDADIEELVYGVSEKVVQAVGLYGYDASGLRVIEVELRVNWALSAELTLTVPTITSGLSGWDGKQAPEVKIAGRRFANTARELGLTSNYWVSLIRAVRNDSALYAQWKRELNLGGTVPGWRNSPKVQDERFLDLGEANIYLRRARD